MSEKTTATAVTSDDWKNLTEQGYTITRNPLSDETLQSISTCVTDVTSCPSSNGRVVSAGRMHFELIKEDRFLNAEPIRNLLLTFQPFCRQYFGERYPYMKLSTVQLVLSSPSSVFQCWHADNTDKGLTFVVPLVNITHKNGPTQFIAGSHQPYSFPNLKIVQPLLTKTDLLVFDARLLHRGGQNVSDSARPLLILRYDDAATPAPGAGYFGAFMRHSAGNAISAILGMFSAQ